jgi:hypothetical protein
MEDDLLKYLYDSKEAAAAILRFVRDKTVDDYARDELLRSGVERKFEMIGEALNRVSRDNPTVRDKRREHRHIVCSGLSSHTATTALITGLCGASLKKTWANSSKMYRDCLQRRTEPVGAPDRRSASAPHRQVTQAVAMTADVKSWVPIFLHVLPPV